MKTIELIETLQSNDLLSIENELIEKSNKRLLSIFLNLKETKSYKKEVLFKLVFNSDYDIKKDYLLRNEIRLLNNFIEEFIVKQEVLRKENDWLRKKLLLQYYLDKKQVKLFEEDWNQSYKALEHSENFIELFELLQLKMKFVSNHLEVNEENYNNVFQLLVNLFPKTENLSIHIQAEVLNYIEFVRRTLFNLTRKTPQRITPTVHYSKDIEQLADKTKIVYCKSYMYNPELSFDEKLPYYIRLIELLKDTPVDIIPIYNNLGVEYFIKTDFENAYKYYALAYEIIKNNKINLDKYKSAPIINFISSAISLKKYEEGITVFIENKEELSKYTVAFHNLQRLIAIAYLAIGKIEKAFEFMPHNINERGKNEYYYYRAVYALGYMLSEEFDLAQRECENSYRALKANPFENGDFEKLFLAIKHLIGYKMGKTDKKQLIIEYIEQEENVGFHIKSLIHSIL